MSIAGCHSSALRWLVVCGDVRGPVIRSPCAGLMREGLLALDAAEWWCPALASGGPLRGSAAPCRKCGGAAAAGASDVANWVLVCRVGRL